MTPAVGKRKLVVIEEGTLTSMSLNKAYVDEFPFLAGLASAARRGHCRCKGDDARAEAYSKARQHVAGLDSVKKQRLKQMLNTEQARINFVNGSGKPIQLTF